MEERVSTEMPALGNEDVEEMIVNEDNETGKIRVVIYTNNGFEPKNLEISLGDTVRFVNESSRGMWVASDIHPTHRKYPEKSDSDCLGSSFDQCSNVSSGESWEFTFNSEGDHGYHNHARASNRGTISVR